MVPVVSCLLVTFEAGWKSVGKPGSGMEAPALAGGGLGGKLLSAA
jgi:hypothetical protein